MDSKLAVTGPGCIEGEWEVDAERDLPKFDEVELIFGYPDIVRERDATACPLAEALIDSIGPL